MTEPSKSAPPRAAPASKAEKKPLAPLKPNPKTANRQLLRESPVGIDVVINEQVEHDHHVHLMSVVFSQTIAIAILTALLLFLAPFMQPIYHYYARDPDGNQVTMNGLLEPNMTNRAVLSWSVTTVTEIMTIGFGDLYPQLNSQKYRFTEDGWVSFVEAFKKQQIAELFKGHQIVLTTVPSDTAVILAQGKNKEGIYEWKVQVPVIMTFATNNNVSQGHHAIVTLVIVRVPASRSPAGIAIKNVQVE